MQTPFVSIVIITRNRPFILQYCIEHVLSQPYPHKEIIVVDSSSNNDSERVITRYPEVISIRLRSQKNNMPQARNEGIAAASGDIVAFIDDDALVQPGWLEALLAAYRDEKIGAVGGRTTGVPSPFCDEVSGPPLMTVSSSGEVVMKGIELFSEIPVEVDHLRGCNMSFRREVLEQIGGFDPNYTLTNLLEETDLCTRVKKAGWQLVYMPAMSVQHYTLRRGNYYRQPSTVFSDSRNSVYFTIKNFGLNPRTVWRQMIVEPGAYCAKTGNLVGMSILNTIVQLIGRVVGLGVGISWLLSSRKRTTANPKIEMRSRAVDEQKPLSATSHSKSVV